MDTAFSWIRIGSAPAVCSTTKRLVGDPGTTGVMDNGGDRWCVDQGCTLSNRDGVYQPCVWMWDCSCRDRWEGSKSVFRVCPNLVPSVSMQSCWCPKELTRPFQQLHHKDLVALEGCKWVISLGENGH